MKESYILRITPLRKDENGSMTFEARIKPTESAQAATGAKKIMDKNITIYFSLKDVGVINWIRFSKKLSPELMQRLTAFIKGYSPNVDKKLYLAKSKESSSDFAL